VCVCMCICVCVQKFSTKGGIPQETFLAFSGFRNRQYGATIFVYTYTRGHDFRVYIHAYVCVCVCVCVYAA